MTTDTDSPSRVYNLRPSLEWASNPGDRLSVHPFAAANLPPVFVFGEDEPIDDQDIDASGAFRPIGSCTANMMDEILWDCMLEAGIPPFHISRLWQYYKEREKEGTTGYDSGATIADTVWVAQNLGFFPETLYPYNTSIFTQRPPDNLTAEAAKHRNFIQSVMLQSDIATTKVAIWNGGGKPRPIGYGFAVYPQYESVGLSGLIAMPSGNALGGHANSKWGWNDSVYMAGWPAPGAWRIHNVWGSSQWGDRGRGWLSYYYPVWDHWQVSPVNVPTPPTPTPVPPTPTPVPPTPPTPPVPPTPPNPISVYDQLIKAIDPLHGSFGVFQYGQYGAEIKRRDGIPLKYRAIISDLRTPIVGSPSLSQRIRYLLRGSANPRP